jgi:transglutaminase-like putative cysteine protease
MLQVITTDADVEASRVTLEREARVLAIYTPEDTDAWQRFYRILYRDSYRKVDSLFRSLIMAGVSPRQDPVLTAKDLLAWIQGFSYARTGGLEDLSTPLDSLYNGAGDCDSLGLLYVILLKHYGIDAILMVSGTYSHAMAAVDVEAPGARFEWQDKKYLVAETTYEVDLGLIAADMADPAAWMGITFLPEIP